MVSKAQYDNFFFFIQILQKNQLKDNMKHQYSSEAAKVIKETQQVASEVYGDTLFGMGSYTEAIEVYQKIIQGGYSVPFQITGLGSTEHSISRYEWFTYEWYDKQKMTGKIKGNVYDSLSLCYSKIKADDYYTNKGILWYQDMIGTKNCYELYMGYANLLSNRSRYDEAIKIYNRVISLQPTLINAYVNIAMIYEYRRIQKSKSTAMAKKILELVPNNMYAEFILARNQANLDERIIKLKSAYQKYPDYVRIANDIGITYGLKKEHRQAIIWYKKCIELAPKYASAYNNVGVRTQLLKQYSEALVWYFKACQLDHEYKAAHSNTTDIFHILKYSDEDIIAQMTKYPNIDPFMFYYYIGLAYYDKKQVEIAIKWYKRAEQLNHDNFQLMNSIGIAYDQLKKFDEAEEYYTICIALNPQYHMAYYNMGILEKARKNVNKAIQWYKKATQVNPRYNKPYNNLGNIYKNQGQYDEAIECYEKAVQIHSTYTLGWTNLGICLLNKQRYQDAFNAFARAKELLPNDNNGLSESNKVFLKESLEKFDLEGDKWRRTYSISHDQKQNLRHLIHSYESNFKQAPSALKAEPISNEIALMPQMLSVVNSIFDDKFFLKDYKMILDSIKALCQKDIQYFQIIPHLIIQRFKKGLFSLGQAPIIIRQELSDIMGHFFKQQEHEVYQVIPQSKIIFEKTFNNFGLKNTSSVNQFKEAAFFDSYQSLYAEIQRINKVAEGSLSQYNQFIEAVRTRSNGISCATEMSLSKPANQKFFVMASFMEKIFAQEINQEWKRNIFDKIAQFVRLEGQKITRTAIVHKIIDVWSDEITLILKKRFKDKKQTIWNLGSLIKGHLMFENLEDLLKALDSCDKLSHLKGYKVFGVENKKRQNQSVDIVITTQVNEIVCELHLTLKQKETEREILRSIQEIQQSPLGCIFGSYLYLTKGFKYPFLANCKDIEQRLKGSPNQRTVTAARFIIDALKAKNDEIYMISMENPTLFRNSKDYSLYYCNNFYIV